PRIIVQMSWTGEIIEQTWRFLARASVWVGPMHFFVPSTEKTFHRGSTAHYRSDVLDRRNYRANVAILGACIGLGRTDAF
ncbi:hypothetical protein, partial [Salmonella enterica]|uniref:hypothetical protein n=1 Tax=Salmonella enterica TaxID=28901 RepID=UPI0039BEB750